MTQNPYPEMMDAGDGSGCRVHTIEYKTWNEGYEARCNEMRDLADRLERLAREMDAELKNMREARKELVR
jgi:flagellar biosynthesis/type III secretory pathway protein FliH